VKILTTFLLSLHSSLVLAINPVDAIQLQGIPTKTYVGFTYTAAYKFINNFPLPETISVTGAMPGSGFKSDNVCNHVTLAPKGQPGSSCTTYIDFTPEATGVTHLELTLKYDNNVVPVHPLSTLAETLCGTHVFPSNTGILPPPPVIDSDQVWRFISEPQLHPMKVTVSPYDPSLLESGQIFNAPYTGSSEQTYGQTGSLMVDNDGNPIWFSPLNSPSLMNTDFKTQTLYGHPVLTFWQGTVATTPSYTNLPQGGAEPGGCFYILDNTYQILNTVSAFNGYTPDVHEFLITPDNTALFFATKVVPMDLTPYGGPEKGAIHDFSIQEVDLATNKLVFFWNALDHIPLTSTHMPASTASQSSNVWDAYHLNSIGLVSDSRDDIVFSSRNTWTIYRLNKPSGNFVWRLAGDGSGDFAIPESKAQFSWQHDARLLPGNIISMFDDACCEDYSTIPPGTSPSHGLQLTLDLINKVATFRTSYFHHENVFSNSQGDTQILANGNRFLGFGSNGYYTEYAEPGNTEGATAVNVLYDAQMPAHNVSYRSYRQSWVGNPYFSPSIAVQTSNNQTTVYASWNGATEVKSWQVYAGAFQDRLVLVANKIKDGFETDINVNNSGPYYQVRALDAHGNVIGLSRIVYQPAGG
jgi:hypothetical protein